MFSRLLQFLLITSIFLGSWFSMMAPVHALSLESPMHLAALPGISGLFAGQRPANLGLKDGQLAACPSSPNCVVSQGNPDAEHGIAPLSYSTDKATAMAKLKQIVESTPLTRIIEQSDDYLYAEFESKLMGFVDDVEFYFDPDASVIQVRSASRLGQSDLGVNRKRIEAIRAEFS